MEAIDLYNKEEKLLEMCRALIPEYKDFYFHSGKGDSGSSEHIGLGTQHPTNPEWVDYTYIHWFELCSTYIIERLYRSKDDLEKYMNCVFTYKFMEWDVLADKVHPVDYLYNLYKKYSMETSPEERLHRDIFTQKFIDTSEIPEPKVQENIDWSEVIANAKSFVAQVKEHGSDAELDDEEHYIYESVMQAIYGKDYFNWHNNQN